jgi:uncharacterized protein with HEPN domain
LRSRRADRLLVEDMLESMGRISGYIAGMGREEFLSDRKTIDAVVRNLEVVGEAASRLTDAARKRRSDIEWPLIVGLRNRIVHEYFGIDSEIVWEIIAHNLPALTGILTSFLDQLPGD